MPSVSIIRIQYSDVSDTLAYQVLVCRGGEIIVQGTPCLVHIVCQILLSPLHVMTPIAPSYASRFMHLSLSFPSENILHIELKRYVL